MPSISTVARRQTGNSECTARTTHGLSPGVAEQLAASIDHLWMLGKVGSCVDHAQKRSPAPINEPKLSTGPNVQPDWRAALLLSTLRFSPPCPAISRRAKEAGARRSKPFHLARTRFVQAGNLRRGRKFDTQSHERFFCSHFNKLKSPAS